MVELIAAAAGGGVEPDFQGAGNPDGEIDRQFVDSAKLRELTGWRPEVELEDGLAAPSIGTANTPRRVPLRPWRRLRLMCGRFTVTAKDTKTIADRFQVELERSLERNSVRRGAAAERRAGEESRSGLGRFNVGRPRRC